MAEIPTQASYLSWPSNPTVHDSSDDTIGETTEVAADILATIKQRAPGRVLHVGPLTLGMRLNPNETTPEGRRGAPSDPRQGQVIAAAWALATISGYIDPDVRAVSFFEPSGPKGLVNDESELTPAGAVLQRLAPLAGAPTSALAWERAPRARGLVPRGPEMGLEGRARAARAGAGHKGGIARTALYRICEGGQGSPPPAAGRMGARVQTD